LVEHSLKTYGLPILEQMLIGGSSLIEDGLVNSDGLKATLGEIRDQSWDEGLHAKLLQVVDMHLAATAYLCQPRSNARGPPLGSCAR